jgi:soluble lytic murein transglycosylase-like protein
MKKRSSLKDRLSARSARTRRALHGNRFFRRLGGRGAATLALGAALSVGGVSEVLDNVHFVVRKDLDGVRVVENDNGRRTVVATLHDGFAANSVFKLSRALPDKLVSQQNDLFTPTWMPKAGAPLLRKRDLFHMEMARLNTAIRRDFFENAMPFGDLIHEKAVKYDVDPALVAAVVETESRFRSRARSQVGARGLMQIMPRTGRWMGARNLDDPEQNIDAGVKYLKYLQQRFDGNLSKAIAAYNGGEGNVKRYDGIPPFRETRTYVNRVMSKYQQRTRQLEKYRKDQAPAGGLTDEGVATLR